MKNPQKYISIAAALAMLAALAVAVPAFAATTPAANQPMTRPVGDWQGRGGFGGVGHGMVPAVVGSVSAVNGTTLIVSGRQGFGSSTPATSFTVDAGNATVVKNNSTSTVANIAVGDTVFVQGTVSGTNVVATIIRDGVMMGRGGPAINPNKSQGKPTPPTSPIQGNGQPVVAGTISTINGSTLTISNKSNVTYTVDASNAKIVQGSNTISVSGLAVGNAVLVQGTINGSSVAASSIIDQAPAAGAAHSGVFGSIGQFFMHLFGF